MKTLSNVIKEYRINNNLSLRDFAKLCNVSHSYIDKLEKGIDSRNGKPVEPTLDVIEKLANAMNTSLEELLLKIGKISYFNNNPKPYKFIGEDKQGEKVEYNLTKEELDDLLKGLENMGFNITMHIEKVKKKKED